MLDNADSQKNFALRHLLGDVSHSLFQSVSYWMGQGGCSYSSFRTRNHCFLCLQRWFGVLLATETGGKLDLIAQISLVEIIVLCVGVAALTLKRELVVEVWSASLKH